MRDHTGCAGVMIGRGSFGNPWLFRDARALLDGQPQPPEPDASDRFAVALQHARLAIELQGDSRKTVIEFRKHFGWYIKGLHGRDRAAPEALSGRVDGGRRARIRRLPRA